MNIFAERLKELREERGLTQVQFAVALNVTQPTVAKWESGDREPNHDMLVTICKFFDIPSDYLLGLSD